MVLLGHGSGNPLLAMATEEEQGRGGASEAGGWGARCWARGGAGEA